MVLLPLLVALCACTPIVTRQPVGPALPVEEQHKLIGQWRTGNGRTVDVIAASDGGLEARWEEDDGTPERGRLFATSIGGRVPILWYELEPERLIPIRMIALDDDAATLLGPDEEAIKAMLAAGEIVGAQDGRFLLLDEAGLESLLAGKRFWSLDAAWPMIRQTAAPPQGP